MARYQKSESERKYERIVELSKQWLSVEGTKLEIMDKRRKILEQMEATDKTIVKRQRLTISDMEAINEAYSEQLKYEQNIRKEKEKQYKLDQKERKELENYNKELNKFTKYYQDLNKNSTEKQGFIKRMLDNKNAQVQFDLNKLSDIREKVTEDVFKQYEKKGIADRDHYKDMINEINDKTAKGLKDAGINKSAEDLALAATALQDFTDGFNTIITKFGQFVKTGAETQKRIYENTYSTVSTRTDTEHGLYWVHQLGTAGSLLEQGLGANIGTSEVMNMWAKLADIGMNQEDMFATALDNVLTNKIVPYLETSTLDFNLLNKRLNNQFVKDIRGINLANLDLANNTYITQDLLKEIIAEVQPMSDEALENLALNSTEITAIIGKLMTPKNEGGAGLSPDQAKFYATNLFKQQKYGNEILRSGSTFEKLAYISNFENGTNIYTNPGEAILNTIRTNILGSSLYPNYDTTENGLLASIGAEGIYGSGSFNQSMSGKKLAGMDLSTLAAITNMSKEDLDKYSKLATDNFSSGKYQTAQTMEEFLSENIATPLAIGNEIIGDYGKDIISALWKIFGAIIGGDIFNGLAPALNIGAGGLGTLLGAAGPVVGAIGAVGAVATAIYLVNKSQDKSNTEGNISLGTRQANAIEAIKAENPDISDENAYFQALKENTAIRGNIGIWNSDSEVAINPLQYKNVAGHNTWVSSSVNKADDLVQTNALNAFYGLNENQLKSEFGIELGWWLWDKDKAGKAKEMLDKQIALGKSADPSIYNKIKAYALLNILNNNSDYIGYSDAAVALNLMMYYKNKANDTYITKALEDIGIENYATSKENLQKLIDGTGVTSLDKIKNVYKLFDDPDVSFYLMDSRRKFFEYPNSDAYYEKMKTDFNLHRQGLAKVPYDGYQAVLHAGETIMTASTTATMENMVQAFRESQNQNYRLDAAIQEQTSQLVAKIDEVINAIGSAGSGPTNFNSPSEKLRNSLRTLTSPLAFQG